MSQVFTDRVRGALVPGGVGEGLFGGKDFDKAAGKMVEFVRLRDMAVERGGIELGEQINAPEMRIDAVGDRNVHQAVFARQGNCGLRAVARQRKQPRPLPPAHNDREDIAGVSGHAHAVSHSEIHSCGSMRLFYTFPWP